MKKSILLAISTCALMVSLASCNSEKGIKGSFSLTTVDSIVTMTQAKSGIKIQFSSDSKFASNPTYESIKLSSDQGNKMTFELNDFSIDDFTRDSWLAKTSEAGTYKVSMTINGLRSANELVITVKEGQYAEDILTLPTNIHISYKNGERNNREVYKIGNSFVSCGNDNTPELYIPDVTKTGYYGNSRKEEQNTWEKINKSPEHAYENMTGLFRVRERGEYIDKTEGSVTISNKSYNYTKYNFGKGYQYYCIKSETLALVYKFVGSEDIFGILSNDFEVTAFDFDLTSFPQSFNLPE